MLIYKEKYTPSYKPIFPHEPVCRLEEAQEIVVDFIKKYNIELIAIGNGTASKETVNFINVVLKKNQLKAKAVVVSEAGASVYSASPLAVFKTITILSISESKIFI